LLRSVTTKRSNAPDQSNDVDQTADPGLLLARAAIVAELAAAVERPKSTVAHHVNVLVEAGMLRVVRTRRVRAIDERYYGRTARTFYVGVVNRPGEDQTTVHANALVGRRRRRPYPTEFPTLPDTDDGKKA
jgi:DNA-binding transcriptional ArsR family regulator